MPSHMAMRRDPAQKLHKVKKRKDQQHPVSDGPEIPGVPYGRKLLRSIDLLRRRKARPDQNRLIGFMLRTHKIDGPDTMKTIRKLIELEEVIEVNYKGSISYRNASNWSRLPLYKNRPEGFRKDKINSTTVSQAFSELVLEEPDYLNTGIPAPRLIDHLLNGHSNPTTHRMVEDFLKKEVSEGNFKNLSNGNYLLVGSTNMSGGSVTISTSVPEPMEILNIARDGNLFDGLSSNGSHNDNAVSDTNSIMKKEDCIEIILGKNLMNGGKDVSFEVNNESGNLIVNTHSKENIENTNCQDNNTNSTVRRSKAERKQKLQVRSDDSQDMFDLLTDNNDDHKEEFISSGTPSPTSDINNTNSFRAARRQVRVKKVFDPSDNLVVKKKRGRQPKNASIVQENRETVIQPQIKEPSKDKYCHFCSSDKPESLVECKDCTTKVHLSCALPSKKMNKRAFIDWRCERCKMCEICHETAESGTLVSCCKCDSASHIKCLSEKKGLKGSKWRCQDCRPKQQSSILEKVSKSSDSSAQDFTEHFKAEIKAISNGQKVQTANDETPKIDPNIPDVSKWKVDEIYHFFFRHFPLHAHVFKDHEIDGPALLLLERKKILENLNLRLGPALKIYKQIVLLQARYDDHKLYWR
ncbi:hypothetical protein TKK_0000852 [Trichogramma kaykai]|uniref:PHD-type domain-containing protein n=1 Tax=Trichogramma kaykai TaxID=54128 RepID=A0ABD2VWL2_9HYME